MAALSGRTLKHYRILEAIGSGGMGVVYRALDTRLSRDVALKVLPAGAVAEENARKRFRRAGEHAEAPRRHELDVVALDGEATGPMTPARLRLM